MSQRFAVELAPDQFLELCKRSQPLAAVLELIWNALDAEATHVRVEIARTPLDAVASVKVIDNGHGMTHEEAVREFRKIGASWKSGTSLSRNNLRALHGKKGQGRFRAFALGTEATWTSVADGLNGPEQTTIEGRLDRAEFIVEDPIDATDVSTGTSIEVKYAEQTTRPLLGDSASEYLVLRLAPYLLRYPGVTIVYDDADLMVHDVIETTRRIELPTMDGVDGAAPMLEMSEWKSSVVRFAPVLLLGDENGVVMHEVTDGIPSGEAKVTAFLTWEGLRSFSDRLDLAEMDGDVLRPLIDAARKEMHSFVSRRDKETRRTAIGRWKASKVYPFVGEPAGLTEQTERAVFDAVALAASSSIADDGPEAELSLRLLRVAIESSPGALTEVLTEVLHLDQRDLADFAELLKSSTLPSIISTTKLVTDRLEFLDDLENLLFSPEGKSKVNERDHLHKVLENNHTWVFGEEYSLVVSERTLTNVLRAHLRLLEDNGETPVIEAVSDSTGSTRRRCDLMLSRTTNGPAGRTHLVVELKRPSHVLTLDDVTQVERYASAVTKDATFKTREVAWEFWLIGDDYNQDVHNRTHQDHLPEGVAMQTHPFVIRVRRWAEVIEENRQRLHFFRERLEFSSQEKETVDETIKRLTHVEGGDESTVRRANA